MKSSPRFLVHLALALVGSSVLLFACSTPPSGSQNPVAQTEQGIQVGLSIYGQSQQTQAVTQQLTMAQRNYNLMVMTPDLSLALKSPVTIHGSVSGLFFSEGVFPVILQDAQGNEIVRAQAHADNDWMTTDSVPFTVALNFKSPVTPKASLIFQKDNPSGLQENDFSQSFAVSLK